MLKIQFWRRKIVFRRAKFKEVKVNLVWRIIITFRKRIIAIIGIKKIKYDKRGTKTT